MTDFCPESLVPRAQCLGCRDGGEPFTTSGTDAGPAGVARPRGAGHQPSSTRISAPHSTSPPQAPAVAARGTQRPAAGADGGAS